MQNLLLNPTRVMPCLCGIGIILWICLLKIMEVGGAINSPPLNTVAEVHGEAIFNCSSSPLGPFGWILTNDRITSGEIRITTGCNVNTGLQNHYRTEQPGGLTTCNLIVFDITMDQAGVYHCVDADSFRALLTVLDSSPTITYNNTPDVMAGENVVIACTLNYSGSVEPAPTLRPYFYWTDNTGNNVSNVYNPPPSNNSVFSQLTVTAGRQNITTYTCHVYLQLMPPITASYATNTPPVENSKSSPTIPVLYNASTPSIVKSSGVSCGTIVLTCNSSGNPAPTYKWYYWNETVSVVTRSEGHILTSVEANKSYRCEAYNKIRNVTCNSSTEYNVSNSDFISNCGTTSPGTTHLSIDRNTTIGLAAGLGGYGLLNIIATIVFLWYYNRKSKTITDGREIYTFRKKARLNGRFPWLRSMLPCLNESRGNAGCSFLWVLLFILMSILTGIIVFPILVAMANCSQERNDPKEDPDIGISNVYQEDTIDRNVATKSGTDAHGHVEAPYDEIGTMHPGRKGILEEPTSSKNKDARKVFYTKVNPSSNTEEGVQRYSVSS